MDLKKYTLKELKELKNKVENEINNFEDGYFYVCNIQSYGNNYDIYLKNHIKAEELLNEYNGDNGFCDLYTNSPMISINDGPGGSVYYIESDELYKRWEIYNVYQGIINNNHYTDEYINLSREELNKMGQVIEPVLYKNAKMNLIRVQKINRILKN
ncbi:hypothetical protein M0Q97_10800 [Candidatus Dojkabacteria bacterium]|jgi:hypothetical protein|nr:hypothetical protein [Candidatus Dojkabacteria bacterium]